MHARNNDWVGEGLVLPNITLNLDYSFTMGSMGPIKIHLDTSLVLTEFVVEDSMSNKWVFLYHGEPENRLYMQRNLTAEPTMLVIGEDFEWPGIPGVPRVKRM